MRVIAGAARDQFASQAGVVVDFKHVHAGVRYFVGNDLLQRFLPALRALVRQSCDQVDIDVGNSCRPQVSNVLEYRGVLVQAPDRRRLAINEGLNAKTDAIHATTLESFQKLRRERSGRAFDGNFRVRPN